MSPVTKDENFSHLKTTDHNFRNEEIKSTVHNFRDAAARAGRKMRNLIHTAEDDLVHARDTVTTQIRTKPVQSSLIALGIGVVLGTLLQRRR